MARTVTSGHYLRGFGRDDGLVMMMMLSHTKSRAFRGLGRGRCGKADATAQDPWPQPMRHHMQKTRLRTLRLI